MPGLVDDVTGIGVWSANLGWRDLDLRGGIAAHVDVPVAIGHDVRSGLLAEHRLGAAREADNVLFVPLGTGLASAILCRGQLVTGSLWTGEIGHIVVVPDGPLCALRSARAASRPCRARARSAAAGPRRPASSATPRRWPAAPRPVSPRPAASGRRPSTRSPSWSRPSSRPPAPSSSSSAVASSTPATPCSQPLRTALTARLGGRDDVAVQAAALGDRAGSLGAATIALDLVGR